MRRSAGRLTGRRPPRTRPIAAVAVALVVASILAACSGSGSGNDPAGTPTVTHGSSTASPSLPTHVAQIAVLTSDTGLLGQSGKGVRDSVQLAVAEADRADLVPGWTIQVVVVDDEGMQSAGQQAATGVSTTKDVLGVVGTLRSTIDEGVQPILNNVGIPMVSPGGTAVELTRRQVGSTVVRPFPTYFRMSPTDADQGPAAAQYAADRLKVKRAAVIDDGTNYGRTLAHGFAVEAQKLGVTTPVIRSVGVSGLTPVKAAARQTKAASTIAAAHTDVVFFGGTSGAAAAFAQNLHAAKVKAPLMGGDALLDGGFMSRTATLRANGDYAVFPGAAAESLATARGFLRSYRAAGFAEPPGPYGVMAYDSAHALLLAFKAAVRDSVVVDSQVRADTTLGLDAVRFTGASGLVTFDGYGDDVDPPLTLYRVVRGTWRAVGVVRLG